MVHKYDYFIIIITIIDFATRRTRADVQEPDGSEREPAAAAAEANGGHGGDAELQHLYGQSSQRGVSVRAQCVRRLRQPPQSLPHVSKTHHKENQPVLVRGSLYWNEKANSSNCLLFK